MEKHKRQMLTEILVEGTTSEYSKATKMLQGSCQSKWIGGISTSITYKTSISALLSYSIGGKILDSDYTNVIDQRKFCRKSLG